MTAAVGTLVQSVAPTFRVEVAIRPDDQPIFDKRTGIYEIIGKRLQALVGSGVAISTDDLFGWAICAKLAEVDGRRTKRELADQVPDLRQHAIHDLIIIDSSLRFAAEPGPGITEYVGVGTGLAVVDYLLTLDASYFRRIPMTSSMKTLDFEGCYRASTGAAYVQVETRGRQDGHGRTKAWEEIDGKKRAFRANKSPTRPGNAPLRAGAPTYLIGTVAEIPLERSGTTRVVIGDPPIPSFDGDPEHARLLQRLRFYQRALSAFQPRGALLAALSERIGNLERAGVDWRKLNEQRLMNWRMEEWELSASIAQTVRVDKYDQLHGRSIFALHSRRGRDGKTESTEAAIEPFFFFGLHRNVLLALARQDFKEIADERYDTRHIRARIDGTTRILYQLPSGLIISSITDRPGELDLEDVG